MRLLLTGLYERIYLILHCQHHCKWHFKINDIVLPILGTFLSSLYKPVVDIGDSTRKISEVRLPKLRPAWLLNKIKRLTARITTPPSKMSI